METNKKISICLTHYNRKTQLQNTLRSIQRQKDASELTEIIIVDDVSITPLQYEDFSEFDLDIKLISLQTKNKWWVNPCIAFNAAFNLINSPITIIQNAECLHGTDIIDYTINNLKQNEYIAMSALNITKESFEKINADTYPNDIDISGANWYCHSIHRNKAFNFCAAIHTEDLIKSGGFDNSFAKGIWFDDDVLLYNLENNNIRCRIEDSQIVFHQWHENNWETRPDYAKLLQINKQLIINKKGE